MVYINDLEGKITKINLSNNTKGYDEAGNLNSGVTDLYDQTTLFRLNGNEDNERYSFFGMDAGLGVSDGSFWLFGSTGNFVNLGSRETLDNIIYGVQDKHLYWKHLNNVISKINVTRGEMVLIQIFLNLHIKVQNTTNF